MRLNNIAFFEGNDTEGQNTENKAFDNSAADREDASSNSSNNGTNSDTDKKDSDRGSDPYDGSNGGYKRYDGSGWMNDNYNNLYGSNNGSNKKGSKASLILIIIFVGLISFFLINSMRSFYNSAAYQEKTYDEFIKMLNEDKIENIYFKQDGTIEFLPVQDEKEAELNMVGKTTYWTTWIQDEELVKDLKEKVEDPNCKLKFSGQKPESNNWLSTIFLGYILPIVIIYFIFFFIMRKVNGGAGGGGIMGMTKSNAKVYVQKETGVTFRDVAGQDEAKESLVEIVDFLHNPGRYAAIGAKLPKGALLVGPPGTGKTLLAKAVAGEGKVPFISISGSDFVEMFVGMGAKRVRELFKQAQQMAPCIIFIDEIDAIGKSRDAKYGGNDEREQTLNQLLSEMDGFDSSKAIFILAATNRPEVLDKALLRPGRFDRRIIVDKPDLKGRHDVLKVHSRGVAMDETVDLYEIALATSGAVGSDLANMINEAAINAVKAERRAICQADLFEAVEVVIAGKEKKDRILGPEEKRTVAYHEVGHALITALEKHAEPVQKITIVPRTMGSLGYVMQVPEEEKFLMKIEELRVRIVTLLAGRAAEEVVFGTITTGASNDIEKATKMARAMIAQYGMSKKFGLMSLEVIENQYLDGSARLNCSDQTAAEIDMEVRDMLAECYADAKKLISENRDVLDAIAEFLYEKETITGAQFMKIFNEVKGITPEEEGSKASEKSETEAETESSETSNNVDAKTEIE